MRHYQLLASQIEGAFGDQSDEEGLPEFIRQLGFYPEIGLQVMEALQDLAHGGDPEQCLDLAANYAHRAFETPAEAVEWVGHLHHEVESVRRRDQPC